MRSRSWSILLVAGLCACAGGKRTAAGDDAPTLKSLASRQVTIDKDAGIASSEEKAIAAYENFLKTSPNAAQRAQAMSRLGNLEMDAADTRHLNDANATGAPDYRIAIARYYEYLKAYPKDPANDRIMYQLARAYEQGGDLESALKTLDQLVKDYPKTSYRDEAQFRRGELLFTARDYVHAEQAYSAVLAGEKVSCSPPVATRQPPEGAGDCLGAARQQSPNPYRERSLYMHGWSLYKQGKLEEALNSFFGVLDLKLADVGDADLESVSTLSRADRELIEDTFRVTSLSLQSLQGTESVPAYITDDKRRAYEFRIYQQLGELYLKQERTKDAADTFSAFSRRNPLHPQAPVLQARVIEIYEQAGFSKLALDAKKEFVANYGKDSEFRRTSPAGWERAQPIVKTHLAELARHYHASAQKTKQSADYQEAIHWYRTYLESFPNDPEAAQNNFLLAELLFEDAKHAAAAVEYEKVAYQYPRHAKSADAGYAALLSYAAQEKVTPTAEVPALQRASVASALRFGQAFGDDPRVGPVLTNAAEKLYTLHDADQASTVAKQVLALNPPAAPEQRRVAWTVVAHTAFERGAFDEAERGYAQVLTLTPDKDAKRNDLTERLAASVYKQGEQARAAGKPRDAVAHFTRVAEVAPQSPVRANAQYDAAASLIELKDWDGAARTLEDFRARNPNHPLQEQVPAKLALVYTEQQQWSKAAAEFERMSDAKSAAKDPKVARGALWQAAELHAKAGDRAQAARVYERYLKQNPEPFETAMEARLRLAMLAKEDGNAARELAWMKEIYQADQRAGAARTNRTRTLGAMAALAMARPADEAYRQVALVEPLQKQLKLKKAKMEEALKAYTVAANYGSADAATEATFHIASIYQDFGRAMLASQRPKRLSKTELEQYNLMLEDQAFPFEEKATELHEVNARRTADGLYDRWVKESLKALGQLRPVRYGKTERSGDVVDAIQ